MTTLKKDDFSPEVVTLQGWLVTLGYLNASNGLYDDDTVGAVWRLQEDRQLPTTGECDEDTWQWADYAASEKHKASGGEHAPEPGPGTSPTKPTTGWQGVDETIAHDLIGESSWVPSEYRSYVELLFGYMEAIENGYGWEIPPGVRAEYDTFHRDPAFRQATREWNDAHREWKEHMRQVEENQQYMWEDGSVSNQHDHRARQIKEDLERIETGGGTGHMEPPRAD